MTKPDNWCSAGHDPGSFRQKSNRIEPWEYDRALYKKRNENRAALPATQRLPQNFFSRFEKLDVLFLGFLNFALIIEALR